MNVTTIIIGGGISGLSLAHRLQHDQPDHRFLLLDAEEQTGGVIRSHFENGFLSEIGPHGFLDNCDESRALLAETGLDRECVKAPLLKFGRYIYLHGRLNLIPQTPLKVIMAPLVPWSAKLRVLAELWRPALEGEPTVAKWVNHRFGPALLPFADAVYTGTYAGDIDRLAIDAVMPGARALEKQHGSLLRGLLARFRQRRTSAKNGRSAGFVMPAMTSFPSGLQRLVDRLGEPLRDHQRLLTNTCVEAISQEGGRWLATTSGGRFSAANIAICLPINSGLKLLGTLTREMPQAKIPETWIASAVFGLPDTVRLPPGFGFLTPERENRFSLGTLFSSNMFSGRAPDGHILIETLVGGRRHPERLALDDETLLDLAWRDVREILAISAQPTYRRLLRSAGGIPQLERGYPALRDWRNRFSAAHPGLDVCGFGWDGIGLNDMIKHADHIGRAILSSHTRQRGEEVKGVYF